MRRIRGMLASVCALKGMMQELRYIRTVAVTE